MNYIKENKRTLLLCAIMLVGVIIIYLVFNRERNLEFKKEGYNYKNYRINEVIPIYVSEEDLAKKYLAEYINLINDNPTKAYELLSDESKQRFTDINSFNYYINGLKINGIMKGSVREYSYTVINNKKCMSIIDNNGNKYVFIENSIMDYKVTIN